LGIDLGHDQRNVGLHAEAGGVVDDDRPGLCRTRREDRRNLAARRLQHDVDAPEVEGVERLDLEDVVVAERDLLADRSGRGERDDIFDREIALSEGGQKFATDIAGRADHRYVEAHLMNPWELESGWQCCRLLTYD